MNAAIAFAKQTDIFLPEPAVVLKIMPMTMDEVFLRVRIVNGQNLHFLPGQFFEISIPGIGECPISITSSPTRFATDTFEMVVRKVGNVTGAIHALRVNDRIGIRGPLGTSFPVDSEMKGKDLLFVCGGLGLVPVRSAIQYVLDRREDYGKIFILYGTRSPATRLFVDELYEWKTRGDVVFQETVDMGDHHWGGDVGVITSLISNINLEPDNALAIVCGPPVMYRFVLSELGRLDIKEEQVFVSLERNMKCGVGKCGHCQINGEYACQTGAVYNYADIINSNEAI